MKYILTLLFATAVAISGAQTTNNTTEPAKPAFRRWAIGVNASGLIPVRFDFEKQYDFKQALGWAVGMPINFSFNKYLSLEFRPTVCRDAVYNESVYTDIVGNSIGTYKTYLTHTTFNAPVLLDLHNPEFLQGHVYAGGFYSQLINSRTRFSPPFTLADGQQAPSHIDHTEDVYDSGKPSGGGLNFGAGLGYHPGNFAVILQYMYYMHIDDDYRSGHTVGFNVLFYLRNKAEKK